MKEKVKKENGPFASFIIRRKIPSAVLTFVFFLCMCFGNWQGMRASLATMAGTGQVTSFWADFLCNNVVAFFLAGILPFFVFYLARMFALRRLHVLGKEIAELGYSLELFYGAGYLVYGAFSMLYFAVPPLILYGETIVKFLVVGAFIALWLWFECTHRLTKPQSAAVITSVGTVYAVLHLVYALYALMSSLMGGLL